MKKKRILIMDDDENIRSIIKAIIDKIGSHSVIVDNGEDAINLYRFAMKLGYPYDLVILDLTIKEGMDGIETVQELKKINPRVKAILSSGYYKDKSVISNYQDYGFMELLPKPYDFNDLKDIIENL